jgi:hypothetical protein
VRETNAGPCSVREASPDRPHIQASQRHDPTPRPSARDGRRGHGPPRRLDRDTRGHRRWRRRDPRAGAAVRHRAGGRAPAPPPRARAQLLDRGRRRGRDAARGNPADAYRRRDRRLWARTPRRHRRDARAGDRAAQRLRDPREHPRPRAARRHAGGLRPRARDALRRRRDGRGGGGALRRDGRRARPEIAEVALADALREPKLLDPRLYETAELFFG